MKRKDIAATLAAGLLLFVLGLTGLRAQADGPPDWLADYAEAMRAPEPN